MSPEQKKPEEKMNWNVWKIPKGQEITLVPKINNLEHLSNQHRFLDCCKIIADAFHKGKFVESDDFAPITTQKDPLDKPQDPTSNG